MLACKTVSARGLARRAQPKPLTSRNSAVRCAASVQNDDAPSTSSTSTNKLPLMLASTFSPFLLEVGAAMAKDGEYGILEGRTFALIHPAVMGGLFAATLYAGYLGYQWRRTREAGEELRALKASAPKGEDGLIAAPQAAIIATKEEERKTLLKGDFRDKHWWMGNILLASGVGIAIEGCVNTYMRTGRLYPGPHLYAGATIVALWAMAAALVPAMQKGDNNARNAHIALNVANASLFAWQVPTGLEIVDKVFQFTVWP